MCCGFQLFKCDEQGQCTDFGQFHPDNSRDGDRRGKDRDRDVWTARPHTGFIGTMRRAFNPS